MLQGYNEVVRLREPRSEDIYKSSASSVGTGGGKSQIVRAPLREF